MRNWIWLSAKEPVKIQTALALLRYYGSAESIHNATVSDMETVTPLTPSERVSLGDKSYEEADGILRRCHIANISMVTMGDESYPDRLRNIPDPPLTLYYRGTLPNFDQEVTLSLVGTRKCSVSGLLTAKSLGGQIAACGGLVISGMALGIDSMAMEGALLVGASVVGIAGGGVDVVYPKSNANLIDRVVKNGCLLSEYPPGTKPHGWHFPRRNRILSGLSLGIIVVEAPEKSGALITARHALSQGRDVYAVPGNIGTPSTEGSNRLLKEGANMAVSGWDVMSSYQADFPEKVREAALSPEQMEALAYHEEPAPKVAQPKTQPKRQVHQVKQEEAISVAPLLADATPLEQKILKLLEQGSLSTADLIDQCEMPAPKVLSTLTMLQVKGHVKKYPGSHVALSSKL